MTTLIGTVIRLLNFQIQEKFPPYGWFHLLFFVLSVAAGVLLCVTHRKGDMARVHRVVVIVAAVVAVLELYKQFNYTFQYENGVITADYQWYAFPWQFCSMPMYVGLCTIFFRHGKVHRALNAFLATFALFAGLCVMFYPGDVFNTKTLGICIQTMICHGSMITVAIYLWYSGYVKAEHKTMLRALSVFAVAVGGAVLLNELAYVVGITKTETFNMFFVSRHCAPSLPVYSSVQAVVPYPWCLIIYIAGFTFASYVILLAVRGIFALARAIKQKRAAA